MAQTDSSNIRKDSVVGVESDHENIFTSDHRPVTSPYCSGFSKVAFGRGQAEYYVLSCLLERYPKIENLQATFNLAPRIELLEVYADVGHTLVHFLFTGRYQTLRRSEAPKEDEDDVEYGRALMTYDAARAYNLNDLASLAQGKAQSHGDALKISSALNRIKAVFSAGLSNDEWFTAHLNEKLGAFFREPDELFDIQDLVSCVGGDPDFDKKLVEVLGQMVRGSVRPHNGMEDVVDEGAEATEVTEPAEAEDQEWAETNTESDDCEEEKGKHNAPESDHGEPGYIRNEKSIDDEDPSAMSPEPPAPDGPVEDISVDSPENREFTREHPLAEVIDYNEPASPAEEDACDGRRADASVEYSTTNQPAEIEVPENDPDIWQQSTENDEWPMPTRRSKRDRKKKKLSI